MVGKKAFLGAFVGLLLFIIFSIIIVLISGLFMYMGNTMKTRLLSSEFANRTAGTQNYSVIISNTMGDLTNALSSLRWISWFLIMGMILSIIIGCFLTPSKPVYFVFYIFLLIMAIIFSVSISNGYEIMKDKNADLAVYFNSMGGTNFMLLNMPVIVTVIGILGGIVMYGSFKVFRKDE